MAALLNATSQDVVVMYPQFMFESILKTASGNPHLNVSLTSVPFKINPKKQQDEREDANGIYVAFVIGIAFSLVPASIITRLVGERENGLYHI